MKWYNEEVHKILEELESSKDGLSSVEAAERLKMNGLNDIVVDKKKPAWFLFLGQFRDFMVAVLLIAAAIAAFTGSITDMAVILSIVIINAVIGFIHEYRAERTTEALKKMSATNTIVLRNGVRSMVLSETLVPGDIVFVKAGDSIPADIRFIQAKDLRVNESSLTGESEAVSKNNKLITLPDTPMAELFNMGFKGTHVVGGHGKGIVISTGMRTELGTIACMLKQPEVKTPLQRRMQVFGKSITYIILVLCAIIFTLGYLRGENAALMALMTISLAVAAIPEALPAVITVALAMGAKKMARKKALVKKLSAVETLGSVTYICTDKTGTLTMNKMVLDKIAGNNFSIVDRSEASAKTICQDYELLMNAITLNNDVYRNENNIISGDSTELALYKFAVSKGYDKYHLEKHFPRVAEIPFDAERKCMTTIHAHKEKYIVFVKGAADILIEGNSSLPDKEKWEEIHNKMLSDGLRVIGFATKELERLPGAINPGIAETGLTILGLTGITDPPREEVKQAIEECRKAGIVPVMITGDHPVTARAIAKRIGILSPGKGGILTGSELKRMKPGELALLVPDTCVYARVTPSQKLEIVKALQARGECVAMTGDGVNDAPALKRADIGVAMSITGTDVSKEAAQMILLDDNFSTIVNAIKEGRRIFDNIRRFIRYILACNLAEICVIFLAPFLGLPLPLLPVHILWINLVTDGLPALALVNEPADKKIMYRKPRNPAENIFAHGLGFQVIRTGLLLAAVTLAVEKLGLLINEAHTQTVVFTVLCWGQLMHVITVHSGRTSCFLLHLLSNKPLILALIITFILQLGLIYIPVCNTVFHTQSLTVTELGLCFCAASFVLIAAEIEKVIKINRKRSRN